MQKRIVVLWTILTVSFCLGGNHLKGFMLPQRDCTAEDVRTLGEWGTRLVRFQITRNWNTFNDNQDLEEYRAWVRSRVGYLTQELLPRLNACGIKVVVDLHSLPGGKREDSDLNMFYQARYAEAFVAVWREIAEACRSQSGIYGYDLVNEPCNRHPATGGYDWWALQNRAAKEIRKVDAKTPIIAESNLWDSPGGYKTMRPLEVENVIYEVHLYEPLEYTHQGVLFKKGAALTYPDAERGWNREYLKKTLEPVREFELKHRAKIYVGEFSAVSWAEGAARYLEDCVSIFKEYGWDWTYHSFREWEGWSLEHEGAPGKGFKPSAENPRKSVILTALREDLKGTPYPKVVAHQGESSSCPANTLAAFRRAVEVGDWGMECDVYTSSDGIPVISHDATVRGYVINDTPGEVLTQKAKLVTLEDLFKLLEDSKIVAVIELKQQKDNDALVQAVHNQIRRTLVATKDRVIFVSFDGGMIRQLSARLPGYKVWWIPDSWTYRDWTSEKMVAKLRECKATGVFVEHSRVVSPALVSEVKSKGYTFGVWTVDDEATAKRMAAFGVDVLCTNRGKYFLSEVFTDTPQRDCSVAIKTLEAANCRQAFKSPLKYIPSRIGVNEVATEMTFYLRFKWDGASTVKLFSTLNRAQGRGLELTVQPGKVLFEAGRILRSTLALGIEGGLWYDLFVTMGDKDYGSESPHNNEIRIDLAKSDGVLKTFWPGLKLPGLAAATPGNVNTPNSCTTLALMPEDSIAADVGHTGELAQFAFWTRRLTDEEKWRVADYSRGLTTSCAGSVVQTTDSSAPGI